MDLVLLQEVRKNKQDFDPDTLHRLKVEALQIAAQLPSKRPEAVAILAIVVKLLDVGL